MRCTPDASWVAGGGGLQCADYVVPVRCLGGMGRSIPGAWKFAFLFRTKTTSGPPEHPLQSRAYWTFEDDLDDSHMTKHYNSFHRPVSGILACVSAVALLWSPFVLPSAPITCPVEHNSGCEVN